jgi:hypothetical protein
MELMWEVAGLVNSTECMNVPSLSYFVPEVLLGDGGAMLAVITGWRGRRQCCWRRSIDLGTWYDSCPSMVDR